MIPEPQHFATDDRPALTVRDLRVALPETGLLGLSRRRVYLVNGATFSLQHGRTLAVVGESGAGKTTLARAVLRLLPEAHITGQVVFDGCDVLAARRPKMRTMRRRMQMIFQDPAGSLDPRMTAGRIVAEPLTAHRIGTRRQRELRAVALLHRVGLPPDSPSRYPHEFSAGQRQRIAIARALATNPDLIVCDEPVSSLDVSIRAQILNLLKDLQDQVHLSYLFIAHDLQLVQRFADDVAVMHQGRIVETISARDLLTPGRANHPCTIRLIGSIPTCDAVGRMDIRPLSKESPT